MNSIYSELLRMMGLRRRQDAEDLFNYLFTYLFTDMDADPAWQQNYRHGWEAAVKKMKEKMNVQLS